MEHNHKPSHVAFFVLSHFHDDWASPPSADLWCLVAFVMVSTSSQRKKCDIHQICYHVLTTIPIKQKHRMTVYMVSEDNSAFRIVFTRVDPWIRREVKRLIIESMKNNLNQVKFLAVLITDKNSSRISKVRRNCKIGNILINVWVFWWAGWPSVHISLYTLSCIGICSNGVLG